MRTRSAALPFRTRRGNLLLLYMTYLGANILDGTDNGVRLHISVVRSITYVSSHENAYKIHDLHER